MMSGTLFNLWHPKMVQRIATVCGFAGSVLAILAPLIVFLPLYSGVTVNDGSGVSQPTGPASMYQLGFALESLPILVFITFVGVIGLIASTQGRAHPRMATPFMWASTIMLFIICVAGAFSIGWMLLVPFLLMLTGALGMTVRRSRASN